MPENISKDATALHSRRSVLTRSAAIGAAALLPQGWAGVAYASDAPEQAAVQIGIVAVAKIDGNVCQRRSDQGMNARVGHEC